MIIEKNIDMKFSKFTCDGRLLISVWENRFLLAVNISTALREISLADGHNGYIFTSLLIILNLTDLKFFDLYSYLTLPRYIL
jgi:hypothetical protein